MKRSGLLVLAAVSGVLAVLAITEWRDWYMVGKTDAYVSQLAETGWVADEQAWRRNLETLQGRQSESPFDYTVDWQIAELRRWQMAGLRLWPERRTETRDEAVKAYARAVAQSPHNGELLARTAARMAVLDSDLAVPLMRQALAIAPYEPVVQFHVADVALRYWDTLDEATRNAVESMLRHAMARSAMASEIVRLARNRKRESVLEDVKP